MSRVSGARLLVLAIAVALAAAGCDKVGDTSIYVTNTTSEALFLKVPATFSSTYGWVARVDPGATGYAFSWEGGPDMPVTLLAADCSVLGVLHRAGSDSDSWVVDGIPGFTARIENHGGSENVDHGFARVTKCGGMGTF